MGSVTTTVATHEFPKIDFRGLKLSNPGTESWVSVRSKVMVALDNVGFFTAVFDDDLRDIIDKLCGPEAKSLFTSVPSELKAKSVPNKPYIEKYMMSGGYDSVLVDEPQSLDSVQACTNILWPQGNPSFCDVLWSYTRQLSELEVMVRRMIIEGLGVAEHFSSHVDSTRQVCLFAEYRPPSDQDTMIMLPNHTDTTLMNIVYQHHDEGLELLAKSGEWLRASPYTFNVVTGDCFEVWSNGRIKPPVHHVKMTSKSTRYSVSFGSQFKDGCIIEAPREMVNAEHPKLFNAFEYMGYMLFIFSEGQQSKSKTLLKDFCGVKVSEIHA